MLKKTTIIILSLCVLSGCITGLASLPQEKGSISVFFCEETNCTSLFINTSSSAPSVKCAIYHPNPPFLEALSDLSKLVVDEQHPVENAVIEYGSGLMHNKFCIINNSIVWTGSWNPAQEMTIPNNVVLIESKTIAAAFLSEFNELHSGEFHGGHSFPGKVILNDSLVEAYFCPEDNCKEQVLKILKQAKKSIQFMAYSFTDDNIGNLLLEKSEQGIEIKGIFDPRKNQYSEFEKLKDFSVITKVHHKVFIIDDSIVITGSYNPTASADEKNDENIVIMHDPATASEFTQEFHRLWEATTK